MRYLKKYLFIAILSFPFVLKAQDACNLSFSGRILDADTDLPVADISIELEKLHRTIKSDGHGFFKFDKLCPGTYFITVSGIGFERSFFEVKVRSNAPTRDFRIEHEGVVLHDVEIIGHQPAVRSTASVQTLDARQLEENSGEVLAKILDEIPGVSMLQTGATISKPVIHGMHSNRVLMVNNGIKQEGQQWGAEHAPEIDPFVASKLTVIKGAESVRYGAEAIGGVILVEPAPLPIHSAFGGSLNLAGNTNGRSTTASALLEGNVKSFPRISWRAQGTLKRGGNLKTADYYLNNTGITETNFSAALSYRTAGFYIDAYYSHFNTELGIFEGAHIGSLSDLESAIRNGRPFSDGSFSYDVGVPRQEVVHDLFKLKAHRDLSNGGQLDLQYGFQRNSRQEYDIRRGDRSEIPALDLVLNSHSLDFSYDRINAQSWRTVVGLNATAIISNSVPGTQATPLIPNYDSFGGGVYIIERVVRDRYELEAGVRYDYKTLDAAGYRNGELYGGTQDFHNISGSLGGIWRFGRNLDVRSNLGLSWRPPTVNELYSNGLHHGSASIENGDEDLGSEQGYKWINTLTYNTEALQIQLSAYAHYLNNYIYLLPTGEIQESLRGAFPVFQYDQTNALFLGADLSASYQFPMGIRYAFKGSYLRAKDAENDVFLPMIPANRMSSSVRYQLPLRSATWKEPYIDLEYASVFRQGLFNPDAEFAAPPAGYNLLHASVGTKLNVGTQTLGVHMSANNLLNTSYKEYMNRFRYYAHDMGRSFTLRLSYQF